MIDDLLGDTSSAPNSSLEDIIITNHINQGILKIFEANYEEAIEHFRKVQTMRPANIVAANNLATCKIFCNKVGESIQILEDLIKKEPLKNINE